MAKKPKKTEIASATQRVKCVARQNRPKSLRQVRVHLALAQVAIQNRHTSLPQLKVVRKGVCLHQRTICGLSFFIKSPSL